MLRPGRMARFDPENLGPGTVRLVGNLCFALFVLGVVLFTIIAATYQPDDPLLHAPSKIESFLTSTSNATFRPDGALLRTGEDFLNSTDLAAAEAVVLNPSDSSATAAAGVEAEAGAGADSSGCDPAEPINCAAPATSHLLMQAAMDHFPDVHFYRFGKPTHGDNSSSCDVAWRFRPKDAKRAAFYKDYRRFVLRRGADCALSVVSVGDYHSGVNARKKKKKGAASGGDAAADPAAALAVPLVGEAVNDALPDAQTEANFTSGRYLIYSEGGDRCKPMDHYLWSFLCALGEAQYLNRTLVVDLSVCLSGAHTASGQNEEGKDLRFYFDFEHLREMASVIEQGEFWTDWGKWQKKDGLGLHLVEDFRVTPMKLAEVGESLIMRKFGTVEPDNYWYRVCEGETESVIQRPWHAIWKSRRLLEIVSAIAAKMNWDFDSVHIVRGEKASNAQMWPNLARDTSPDALLSTLGARIDEGRSLYIATDEKDLSFFAPLRDKYQIHFLEDFKDLWGDGSEWDAEMKQLNNGVPVEFDQYMRGEVDAEVFLRGKKQLETFNDLTSDCKDGVNTCNPVTV